MPSDFWAVFSAIIPSWLKKTGCPGPFVQIWLDLVPFGHVFLLGDLHSLAIPGIYLFILLLLRASVAECETEWQRIDLLARAPRPVRLEENLAFKTASVSELRRSAYRASQQTLDFWCLRIAGEGLARSERRLPRRRKGSSHPHSISAGPRFPERFPSFCSPDTLYFIPRLRSTNRNRDGRVCPSPPKETSAQQLRSQYICQLQAPLE